MLISIARASQVTNTKPLPESLLQQLVKKYSYMPDIEVRLRSLPEIKRGKNIGKMPASTPHDNAVAFASHNSIDLYVGYIILPDLHEGLRIVTHSFCVKDNEVIEPTASVTWGPKTRYVGYKVPESQYGNFEYLNRFNRLFV